MEQHIPIDIHIPKLLEWFISRNICKVDWQAHILTVREKINIAIQDMPEHKEITELLSGTYINYFHCNRIVEILKGTEADTKNLFGFYGSQRMKDWQEIIHLYQKNSVYLAEAASLLFRMVKYEVPNLRKQLAKSKQTQQDCQKKVVEYEKSVSFNQRELDTMYLQLGITGTNVRSELLKLVSQLDNIYKKIAIDVQKIDRPLKYYSAFSQHITGTAISLPIISFIIDRGNATTYEWLYGEPPKKIEKADEGSVADKPKTESSVEEIDWGVPEPEISDSLGDGIDWGDSEVINNNTYGIVTVEDAEISVQTLPSQKEGIAKGIEAYTILDNPKTRDEFVAQLSGLQSFLKMRVVEVKNDEISVPSDLQKTTEDLAQMLRSVQVILDHITDSATNRLHFIKHSKRLISYIEKVATSLENKVATIEKMVASIEALKLRAKEAAENETQLKPKLKISLEKTRKLQQEIEQDISKRYKNRPVHLIGGV